MPTKWKLPAARDGFSLCVCLSISSLALVFFSSKRPCFLVNIEREEGGVFGLAFEKWISTYCSVSGCVCVFSRCGRTVTSPRSLSRERWEINQHINV